MEPEKITSLDVSIAAGKGDELALKVYDFTGNMLGEACADFAAFSSPEAFIFFGGLTKAGDLIMEPIKKSYNEHALNLFKNKPQFLVSGLDGSSAAVLGASAMDGTFKNNNKNEIKQTASDRQADKIAAIRCKAMTILIFCLSLVIGNNTDDEHTGRHQKSS